MWWFVLVELVDTIRAPPARDLGPEKPRTRYGAVDTRSHRQGHLLPSALDSVFRPDHISDSDLHCFVALSDDYVGRHHCSPAFFILPLHALRFRAMAGRVLGLRHLQRTCIVSSRASYQLVMACNYGVKPAGPSARPTPATGEPVADLTLLAPGARVNVIRVDRWLRLTTPLTASDVDRRSAGDRPRRAPVMDCWLTTAPRPHPLAVSSRPFSQ